MRGGQVAEDGRDRAVQSVTEQFDFSYLFDVGVEFGKPIPTIDERVR